MKNITVILKQCGSSCEQRIIEPELSAIKKLFGTEIESCVISKTLLDKSINSFCKKEALIEGEPIHLWSVNFETVIFGDVVFVKLDQDGNCDSLSDSDIKLIESAVNHQII